MGTGVVGAAGRKREETGSEEGGVEGRKARDFEEDAKFGSRFLSSPLPQHVAGTRSIELTVMRRRKRDLRPSLREATKRRARGGIRGEEHGEGEAGVGSPRGKCGQKEGGNRYVGV